VLDEAGKGCTGDGRGAGETSLARDVGSIGKRETVVGALREVDVFIPTV